MLKDICNTNVYTISPTSSVAEAAKMMYEKHVGILFIVESLKNGKPIGIISDRDIITKVIAKDRPIATTVREVMSTELILARESDGVQDTIAKMRQRGIRRIGVVGEDDQLFGVLSADDLYEMLSKEFNELASISHRQIANESTGYEVVVA
ncbi:MAG: CBS domain-containing protein [Oligoflexales bacterium]